MCLKLGTLNGEIFKALRETHITWEVFIRAFPNRLFPRNKREVAVEHFINLLQGGMSIHEYSLKFSKFSMYAPYFVSNPRD